MNPATRRYIRGVGITVLAIGLVGTIGQSTGAIHRSLDPAGLVFVDAALAGLALIMWRLAGRRVTIDDDSIQVTGGLTPRTLRREEILGWHTRRGYRSTYYYVIVPRDRAQGELALPPFLQVDAHFHDWMRSITKIRE
jgi:hypothetical protein